MGEVAHDPLDEEGEADPLVPRVPDLIAMLGPTDMQNNEKRLTCLRAHISRFANSLVDGAAKSKGQNLSCGSSEFFGAQRSGQ